MSYQLKGGEEIRDGVLYGWTGKVCPKCIGTGIAGPEEDRCDSCAGTGEEWGRMPIQPPNLTKPRPMSAPEKLEPCPFCSGQVKICQEPYDNGYVAGLYYLYHIWDTDNARSCRLHVSGHFDSREQAISFWNTRATLK